MNGSYAARDISPFASWLSRNAERCPDKTAIRSLDQNTEITHGELFRVANRIGHYYRMQGIGVGDRVALLSHNSIEHLIIYLASLAYGCTICTIHVEMNAVYFEDILKGMKPRFILCEDDLPAFREPVPGQRLSLGRWQPGGGTGLFAEIAQHDDSPPEGLAVKRTDDISIFFTSGTATRPKGVVCSLAELHDNTLPTADAFGLGPDDRMLDYRSMNWMSAQVLSALGVIAKGATLLLAERFSVGRFFNWVNDNGATIAAGNPTILNMLVNRESKRGENAAPSLRYVTSSSSPLLTSEWLRFEKTFGLPVCQGYGTSETGWIAGTHEATRRLGSVGRPYDYQRLRIVDAQGNVQPVNQIGAIQTNGNPVGRYRYLDADGTIRVNAEGSILTGDLGFLDADGYLFLTGREKDLIIRGGVNISPLEIDNVVLQMPGIADVATVGVPDPTYGEQVIVHVVAENGSEATAETILEHCRNHLAAFKMPGQVVFREDLPRTVRGKMDRKALTDEWQATGP